MEVHVSLKKRLAVASKYQPNQVKVLLVAEAPPCDLDRYFYFEDVDRHDWLFMYVWQALKGTKAERPRKAEHLAELQRDGVFLIDLHEENISKPKAKDLEPEVPGLVTRCKALKPQRIILIKSIVHDVAFEPLKAAGLPVVDERIPFPASGQQKKFLEAFGRAVGT